MAVSSGLEKLQSRWARVSRFDDNLRQAFQRETELLFESILREDRSVVDLLNADYTFVNERLAKHYGIANVYGPDFRRVPVPSDARRGLLGQGSMLLVTSNANRTSPVQRGKWILENLLGSPPPLPPPNVPPLKENSEQARATSVRERMEQHRANPVCAGCHKIMDPIGLTLENFDGVGHWRDHGFGIYDRCVRPTGGWHRVDGPSSLRKALLDRPEAFVGTVTEKLLMYAVGRETKYYDMPVVRAIMRDAMRNASGDAGSDRYRFSELVLGIVKSAPFQMRMKEAAPKRRRPRKRIERQGMMFITKKHLPRRTFLRGMGVTLALPLLDSMVPAQTPLSQDRRRSRRPDSAVSTCRTAPPWTNGLRRRKVPRSSSTEILKPLEKLRDRICVVSNLAHPAASGVGSDAGADHARSAAVFLSGAHPEKGSVHVGMTIDQMLAQHIGQDTPLPSLELAIEEVG